MKRDRTIWKWIGFAVTAVGGTLLHFLYELTGDGAWSAFFSGVNESTWEHMKLFFVPWFFFALFQRFFFREDAFFWCGKLTGGLLGLLLIPVLFYTYNGAFGPSPDWLNISFFFIAAGGAFLGEDQFRGKIACKFSGIPLLLLIAVGVLFCLFTLDPPLLPLFRDPITGGYGILSQ